MTRLTISHDELNPNLTTSSSQNLSSFGLAAFGSTLRSSVKVPLGHVNSFALKSHLRGRL